MKTILVVGSAFVNRGSESMMFVAADELKKRFPNHEVVMLSPFDYRKDVSKYSFTILPDYISRYMPEPFRTGRKILKRIFGMKSALDEEKKYKPLFENVVERADFMINIGGYALSSQKERNLNKPWGTLCYLAAIMFCEKRRIPMYLMPQSFGPFEYKYPWKPIIMAMMRKYLKYPRIIFAREKEGYDYIKPYCKGNVVKRINDTVLTNSNMDVSSVFTHKEELNLYEVKENNAVAVIPNMRCIDTEDKEIVVSLYKTVIDELLRMEKNIYLIRHSKEDIELCRILKDEYKENGNVNILENEFNSIEMQYLLKQFEFVVASRFHAIVHSYLHSIPCLIIGWATKYYELASLFNQGKYVFDVREKTEDYVLCQALRMLNQKKAEESKRISALLYEVQKDNSYDILERDYKKSGVYK